MAVTVIYRAAVIRVGFADLYNMYIAMIAVRVV